MLDMSKKLRDRILEQHVLVEQNTEEEREKLAKLTQLINVLEKYSFEGLNRKVVFAN